MKNYLSREENINQAKELDKLNPSDQVLSEDARNQA